jgi:hypothetical protein
MQFRVVGMATLGLTDLSLIVVGLVDFPTAFVPVGRVMFG